MSFIEELKHDYEKWKSSKIGTQEVIDGMLAKYGEDIQIDVAIEEMSELIKELIKYKRSKVHFREKQAASRDHVIEEIGDVMLMLEYLKTIFNINPQDIEDIMINKAMRVRERYLNEQ